MNKTPDNHDVANSVPYYYEEKKKYNYTLTHGIYALLAFLMGTLWYRWVFSYPIHDIFGEYKALPITLFALAFALFTVSYFKFRKTQIGRDSYILMIAMLVFSLRFTLYPTDTLSFIYGLALFLLHVTALLFVYSVGTKNTIDVIVGSTAKAMFAAPFASFHRIFTSLSVFFKLRKKSENSPAKHKKLLYESGFVLLGLLIALPIAANVLALLDSDGFFSNFVDGILDFLNNIHFDFRPGNYVNIITVLVSMFIFGAVFDADKKRDEEAPAPLEYRRVPETIGKTVLIVLIAVYALFMLAQIDGFTHMLRGEIPELTTYAEFARSGFFELGAVACINGATLYFFELLSLKKNPEKNLGITKILLIAFTLFLILTAAVKMVMYIGAYGFTPKRFYTLWFMILLTVLFVMSFFKLRNGKFRLSRYAAYVTLLWLAVLFLVDFGGISDHLNLKYFFM